MKQDCMREYGRSMTEMLGVLAIIGVLSIGAIVGFRYAMDKKQANDLINAVALRTQVALSQLVKNDEITLVEFPESVNGSSILGTYEDPNIVFNVSPVPEKVCRIVSTDKPSYWSITLNGIDSSSCLEGENTLVIKINKEANFEDEGDTPSPDLCDGACGECQTCNVTTNTCDNLPDTTPCEGGAKECNAGACMEKASCPTDSYSGANPGECCMANELNDQTCCSAGQVPYCYEYSSGGSGCRSVMCGPKGCTPNAFNATYNTCCTPNETAYCYESNYDLSCETARCETGKCTPAPFPIKVWTGICCASGTTPYCYAYDRDGVTCLRGECEKGVCTQQPFPIYGGDNWNVDSKKGACCATDETAWCAEYNTSGQCVWALCQAGSCTQYCDYKENGKCLYGGCCGGTVTPGTGDEADMCN